MVDDSLSPALHRVRRSLLIGDETEWTDGQLLELFIQNRDGAAFEALVYRHGSMVFGVCSRVTRHRQEAEDAFQATFLVLARKASSVRPADHVGNWLYGVAYRTAMKARTNAARRAAREKQTQEIPEPMAEPHVSIKELLPILDQELVRLPDIYRMPLILCDLEERPRKEVAQQLGIPEGTLSSRLTAARKKLADRLSRRGFSISVVTLSNVLMVATTNANVPKPLLQEAVQNSLNFTENAITPNAIPESVVALANDIVGRGKIMRFLVLSVLSITLVSTTIFVMATDNQPKETSGVKESKLAPIKTSVEDQPKPKSQPVPSGLRKQLETKDWLLTQVDPKTETISVADKRDSEINPQIVIAEEKNRIVAKGLLSNGLSLALTQDSKGIAPTGFSLNGLPVDPKAIIQLDGKPIALTKLPANVRAKIQLSPDRLLVTRIEATAPKPYPRYIVTRVDPTQKTLSVQSEESKLTFDDLPVSEKVVIEFLRNTNPLVADFEKGTWDDLKVGMTISLETQVTSAGTVEIRLIRGAK
jgi:RNA polymerase sigma factor (sigma-70 family)